MRKLCGAGTDVPLGLPRILKLEMQSGGWLESFYLPPAPSIRMRQCLFCWVEGTFVIPVPLLLFPPPLEQQTCGSAHGKRGFETCVQAWICEWKVWALLTTERGSLQLSAQSCISCASSPLCPAFPERCAKAIWLSAPNCTELKIRSRMRGSKVEWSVRYCHGPALENVVDRRTPLKISDADPAEVTRCDGNSFRVGLPKKSRKRFLNASTSA